jgi:hypothetical protein
VIAGTPENLSAVMPDLIRHPADARLRNEKSLFSSMTELAGPRLKAGVTECGCSVLAKTP